MQQEPGVFTIPIQLDEGLECDRSAFRDVCLRAQRRLMRFAREHGWQDCMTRPFAQSWHVFSDKRQFDEKLRMLCGIGEDMSIPSTYCAALEKDTLISVSPALYSMLFPQGVEPDAYEKLITHEFAHRLHIRILQGNEDAMGPIWFFEGFALLAAEQLIDAAPVLDRDGIVRVVESQEREDYRRYVTVIRYFAARAHLRELVERAGRSDFTEWLRCL